MPTMFARPRMFITHIKDTKLKIPDDPDNYDPEEFPRYHMFMTIHLCQTIDVYSLENNAKIFSEIKDEEIETVTIGDLIKRGLYIANGDWD